MTDSSGQFIVLEPSKVGSQHITLLEGYLVALARMQLAARELGVIYRADPSSFAAMSPEVRAAIQHDPISVLDVEKRQWVTKIFQELSLVLRSVAGLKSRDLLLVTCVSSPTLLFLELLSPLFGSRRVVALVHGEMEALFDPRLRGFGSWGGWAYLWSKVRRPTSKLHIAVLAAFIGRALETKLGNSLSHRPPFVLPHPITERTAGRVEPPVMRVVFIGYRTRLKGFSVFERQAKQLRDKAGIDFVAVGAGTVESISSGSTKRITGSDQYLDEISQASIALFPYEAGYDASLSAAALDAISTGVHIVATKRQCFVALREQFGAEFVTLYDDETELHQILTDVPRIARLRSGRANRIAAIASSAYGNQGVIAAFADMLDALGIVAKAPDLKQELPQ
jgi:hypothetical protein